MPLLPVDPPVKKSRTAARAQPVNTFSELARADDRMIRLHEQRRAGHFSVNVDKLCQEMIRLHAGRTFPRLTPSIIMSDTQKTLMEGRHETSAIHSRVTHIKLVTHVKKRRLDEHIKRMKYYLAEKYHVSLIASTTTQKGQESLVNSILREFYSLSYSLETVLQTADMLLHDLDKSDFAINFDISVIELSTRPQRNI